MSTRTLPSKEATTYQFFIFLAREVQDYYALTNLLIKVRTKPKRSSVKRSNVCNTIPPPKTYPHTHKEIFEPRIVNIFLSINLNMRFGHSKELS